MEAFWNNLTRLEGASLQRVNLWGCALMLIGLAVVLLGPKFVQKEEIRLPVKLGGLGLTFLGALLAMKLFG